MSTQMDLFEQMDRFDLGAVEPLPPPEAEPCGAATNGGFCTCSPPPEPLRQIDGWVKTRSDGKGLMPVATLIRIPNDACDYRPARFELAEGLTVARWPSGDAALYYGGERIALFTAVDRRLAREIETVRGKNDLLR